VEEIDRLLKQWIPVNTIIREEIRNAIVKEIEKEKTRERIKLLTWDNQLKNKR
tara:strand:+ start:1793 stop:1951 length:159 start_codon:yes stop_codon:yes gene_type:complete